jgi:hypothetical protein
MNFNYNDKYTDFKRFFSNLITKIMHNFQEEINS